MIAAMLAGLRLLVGFPRSLAQAALVHLPSEAGVLLRRLVYSRLFRRCGRNLTVAPGVLISGHGLIEMGDDVLVMENAIIRTGPPQKPDRIVGKPRQERGVVSIGSGTAIGYGAIILGQGGVSIGTRCGLGLGTIIVSESFHHKGEAGRIYSLSQRAPRKEQYVIQGAITIGDGASVASHAMVLPGAAIGEGAWVAPNSIVKPGARIPANVIAQGDPAVPVTKR